MANLKLLKNTKNKIKKIYDLTAIITDFNMYVKYKFEFNNQRRKTTFLAGPLFASNRVNIAINRAVLTV